MRYRIADTFTDSLTKLRGNEQKAVKTTAFDLQINPANPGMQFHRIDRAKDPNFWSVRVNQDIRLIVHKSSSSLLLCYVDHHDKAYQWAQRRKLETHPTTGAAQLVEIRETFREIVIPTYTETAPEEISAPPVLADFTAEDLLGYGVPSEWVDDLLAATEDNVLDLIEHLPAEAAEAVLSLATGVTPALPEKVTDDIDPFDHPDAKRRFQSIENAEELERALLYPWDKWTIFLHPVQRKLVDFDWSGPARVSGSAGTGKTIVALHRAVYLTRANEGARVLLTTFSKALANALRTKLRRLISNEPKLGERLEIHSMDAIGKRLYKSNCGRLRLVRREDLAEIIESSAAEVPDSKFTLPFLLTEWEQVIDAWQVQTWEAYREVPRLGRKTRLPENRRVVLWEIFSRVRSELDDRQLKTTADMYSQLAKKLLESKHPAFDFAVIDESQDVSVSQLRFLAALGGDRRNGLFFAGDLGQRIFQQPFSWLSLGVDIRGRSKTLRINYRTSHQIRSQADRLLGPEIADVDGNVEDRRGAVSVFTGREPTIVELETREDEISVVSKWIVERQSENVQHHEIGVFVRTESELERARVAVQEASIPYRVLDESMSTVSGKASVSTMHLAKGLEFRAVVVMACNDKILPLQSRMESAADEADLADVYDTERNLLYVACTRARDFLLVTGVKPASEFLEDLEGE